MHGTTDRPSDGVERLADAAAGEVRVCLILSAGRTGTVFLSEVLDRALPATRVVHEPFPGRYEHVLANARNALKVGDGLLRRMFRVSRRLRLSSPAYVEINPFLCPATDLLEDMPEPFNIVHIVREPVSWAGSITAFRASRPFRHAIDFVPFAKPSPAPRPRGWRRMPELQRALWRWRFCNERIAEARRLAHRYRVIRYEELFSDCPLEREAAMAGLVELLPERPVAAIPAQAFERRRNAAPAARTRGAVDRRTVRAICGDLLVEYGYDRHS